MSGILYDLKKIKAVVFDIDGVLSPSVIPMDENGEPVRMMNVKDGYAIYQALRHNLKIVVISGSGSVQLRKRFEYLKIKDVYLNIKDKSKVLKEWMSGNNISSDEMAYMGDDIPDLRCMRMVGLPCAPFDAAVEARQSAVYVSRFTGGYGCVRDLLEQILRSQGNWLTDEGAFMW